MPISPDFVTAGDPGFTLTVTGTGFQSDSLVYWDGSALATTYVSSTQLTAVVPAGLIATAGVARVSVFNPPPGCGEGPWVPFLICCPAVAGGAGPNLVFRNEDITSDGANHAFWTVIALPTGPWDIGHWEFIPAQLSRVYGSAEFIAASAAATVNINFFATTAAGGNVRLKLSRQILGATTTFDGAWTDETAQTVAVGTQYARFVVSFPITAAIGAGSLFAIRIERVGNDVADTYPGNLAMFSGSITP